MTGLGISFGNSPVEMGDSWASGVILNSRVLIVENSILTGSRPLDRDLVFLAPVFRCPWTHYNVGDCSFGEGFETVLEAQRTANERFG